MLADITVADRIHLITGYTDYPRNIVIHIVIREESFRSTIRTDICMNLLKQRYMPYLYRINYNHYKEVHKL